MELAVTRPIHVCIVTTAHPVDDKRVNAKIAQSLRGAGFRVSWVGPGHAEFDPSLAVRQGIEFVLTKPIRTRLGRLLASRRLKERITEVRDVDVYFAPDPDSVTVALHMAARDHAKVIFDIHEIYHGAQLSRWVLGLEAPVLQEFVRRRISRACAHCDLVVGVSDAVLTPYMAESSRRMVVRSCAPRWFADGPAAEVMGAGRTRFRLMHGMASAARGAPEVLEATKIALGAIPTLQVVMIEAGTPELDPKALEMRALAARLGTRDALELVPGVPIKQMPALLQPCDVGVIAYGRDFGVDSLPNRLFEYMAVGLPVIAPSYSTEVAKIVEAEQCGLLADCEDPASIAAALIRLHGDPEACRAMGRRGREAFLRRHNWEVEVQPLLDRIRNWFPERVAQ